MIKKSKMLLKVIKIKLLTVIIIVTTASVLSANAATTSPEADISPDTETQTEEGIQKAQELKDRLATKVAELREEQKRGFYGSIAALARTAFTLVSDEGEIRVEFNEDTQFIELGARNREIDVGDLFNTQTVSVLGLFDENQSELSVKVILVDSIPEHFTGVITDIDTDEAIFTVQINGDEVTFDYERTTDADEYDPENKEIAKSGLSRLSVGDTLHVWAEPSQDDSDVYTALSLLRLPQELFEENKIESTTTNTETSVSPVKSPRTPAKTSPTTVTEE